MITQPNGSGTENVRLTGFLPGNNLGLPPIRFPARQLIGILEGAGIGPQIISATLHVLKAVEQALALKFEVRHGGLIGEAAAASCGKWLPEETMEFCADIFQVGGAILNGPGGGRYVYDLRRRFDLFCKFVPVRPIPELAQAGRIAPRFLKNVDLLIVRENTGGVYQGRWGDQATDRGRFAEHSFSYSTMEVHRLVEVAARAAVARRGKLHIIVKEGGIPTVTALWREVGGEVARRHGIEVAFKNVDLAAYELIQNPASFDVIAAPNLFGDILADVTGVLLSSRGVTFSGNFDAHGHGVYQTNHGCAHDLAGADAANPAGQMLSLAMLLRESFGLEEAAALIERSLAEVWRAGWRTADLAEPGCRILGTKAMAKKVAEQVMRSAGTPQIA
ncbi:MAG TPA: isocitrate/isopropylmalate family dehydrogenase [Candidatus Nitrosopolaris sp.]|nr:isocitrate/isopropylmalate family dehydrogenase [Candidatus Nitrosopolaris sp.]